MDSLKIRVRAKIIEAVPEIGNGYVFYNANTDTSSKAERPIQLADVLRAINDVPTMSGEIEIATDGQIFYEWQHKGDPDIYWNLSASLDEQEDEVIEFLGKILGV